MKNILLIGARQNKFDANDRGGVTVLFELLIKEFHSRDITFDVIDTLKANNGGSLRTLLGSIKSIVMQGCKYDHISLHGTHNSFYYLAPVVLLVAKICKKRTSIRLFAGDFGDYYDSANPLKQWLARQILQHTDTVFFELKFLVERFITYNKHTYWFPNVREAAIQNVKTRKFRKKFIYLGTINKEKGIDEIVETSKRLPEEYQCDLYGPLIDEKYNADYFKSQGVKYMGVVAPHEVPALLEAYDVLVLPSYKEGYPGVIIEAFAAGMPVIATKLPGIIEMCDEKKNALLIDVGSTEQLYDAIVSIDEDSYQLLHQNALEAFAQYDSEKQTDNFLTKIGYTFDSKKRT